jgi:hypothetical protein
VGKPALTDLQLGLTDPEANFPAGQPVGVLAERRPPRVCGQHRISIGLFALLFYIPLLLQMGMGLAPFPAGPCCCRRR